MRLNKFLAHAGVDSRRNCDDHIFAGKVTVNGEVVEHPGHQVDPDEDLVRFEDEVVSLENKVYYRYHKPVGQASTTEDPNIDNTLEGVVNQVEQRIYPVGRLDQDSRGLLLLTNDGDLTHVISHPKHGITKEYEVVLDRSVQEQDLDRLRSGEIELDGRAVRPEEITATGDRKVRVQLLEGRNRQIRRMFEKVGYDVVDLLRTRIGPVTLDGLSERKLEQLSSEEVEKLTALL